jgi:ribosomal-protein-alanine N-acetyltransferase
MVIVACRGSSSRPIDAATGPILRSVDVLTTDRLRLRRLTLADTDDLLDVLGDPVAMAYYPAPKDRDGVIAWIEWAMASYEANGFGLWAIERIADGAVLGDCGPMLQPVDSVVMPEIGYHLVRHEWGHGYATEAARACLDWVFQATAYDRVCSIVHPDNLPSRRVAERVHRRVETITWERTGTRQCWYSTTREQLVEPTIAVRAILEGDRRSG